VAATRGRSASAQAHCNSCHRDRNGRCGAGLRLRSGGIAVYPLRSPGPGLLETGPSVDARIATLDRVGVKLVRFTVNWREVARRKPARAVNPNDPPYDWARADAILKGLRRHRIAVLVTLWGTPRWANRGRGANVVPRNKYSFAAFARAVATRYPWIRLWEVWNEPNLRVSLKPNSPALYVHRLLNPT
jgi:beta-glucosidase/6-phospho-beta-glucosidase/beta-galactosidase